MCIIYIYKYIYIYIYIYIYKNNVQCFLHNGVLAAHTLGYMSTLCIVDCCVSILYIYIYIYMYIYFICMHFIKCKFEGHLVMHFIIYNYFKRQIFYHESFLSTKLCCRSEKFLLYFLIYNNKIIRSRINFALETTNFSLFRLAILSETAV